MKLQWYSMNDFARKVLKKLGAVPVSDLHEAYRKIGMLGEELNNIAHTNAKSFPYLIEPSTNMSFDQTMMQHRIQMKPRYLNYIIDKHIVNSLGNEEYKKFLIRHLSSRWAEQTEEILEEMMEQMP